MSMGNLSNKQQNNRTSAAFTLVELLIVIVVIAILAAITVVAYNGISKRAQASVAQEQLSQINHAISSYFVDNNAYPTQLSALNIQNTSSVSYQYSVNNTATPATWCVTATSGTTSYYQNNTDHTIPTPGGCPGHGQNGVAAITNLVPNPGVELNTAGWGYSVYSGTSFTFARSNLAAHDGLYGVRLTWLADSASLAAGNGIYFLNLPVTYESAYTASVWIRSSANQLMQINVELRNASNQLVGTQYGSAKPLTAGQWMRLYSSFVVSDTSVSYVNITVYQASGAPLWKANDTLDGDSFMLTSGSSLYNYADPSTSPSWIWNGTPNASTSTGPVL